MGRLWLLSLLLGLLHIGFAAKCPRQRTSPGKEILCYTESYNIERLEDVICSCTVLVHQGHDIQNLPGSGFKDLRHSLKEKKHDLRFVLAVSDIRGFLRTSGMMRQEAATRLANILNEVDGVELNVTAGSKERLVHFVKGLKDEMIRKSNEKAIFLALPAKPELLAKQFDLKELSKYVDFFTTSTHYLVDEEEAFHTFHPSRLMGLFDMLNTDSVIDLIIGLGAPKSKIIMSVPTSAYKFALKDEEENTPRSPTNDEQPIVLDRKQLCDLMSVDEWTLERDDDLTAPYAFKNKDWIAFEDRTSIGIKGKYVSLRGLAGLGIRDIENDMKNNCSKPITQEVFQSFTNLKRKSRQAVLSSLENELHTTQLTYPNHVKSSGYRISRVVDTKGHIHAIREHSHTEFSCTRQGYFVHPKSCNRFYRCVKFNQEIDDFSVFEFDCPAGLAFDERTEVCVWPGSLSHGSPCVGSSEIAPVPKTRFECPDHPGYYADPQNCRWFFACFDLGGSHMIPYEFRCPFGLVFDEDKLICEWPWLVPKCGGGGYTYSHFGGYGGHDYGGHGDYGSHEDHGGDGDYGGQEDHWGNGDYGGHGGYGGNGGYDGYGGHHVSPVHPGGMYGMKDHDHGGDGGVKGGHDGNGGHGGDGGYGGHGNGGNGGHGGSYGGDGDYGGLGSYGGNGGYDGYGTHHVSPVHPGGIYGMKDHDHGGDGGIKGGHDGNGGHGGHNGNGGHGDHGSGGHKGHNGNGGHKGHNGNGGHKGHNGNGGNKGHNGNGGTKGHGGHDGRHGGHDDQEKHDDSDEHYGGHDTSPVFPGKDHGTNDNGHDNHGGNHGDDDDHGKDDDYDKDGKDDDYDKHGGKDDHGKDDHGGDDDNDDHDDKHSDDGYDDHHTTPDYDHHTTPDYKHHTTTEYNHHTTKHNHHTTPDYKHHTTTDYKHHTTHDYDHHTTPDYNHHTTDYNHHTTDHNHHTTDHNHHTTDHNHHTTPDYNHHTTNHNHHTTDHNHHTTPDYNHHTTDHNHHTTDHNHHTTDHNHHTTDHNYHTTTDYNHHTTTDHNHYTTTDYDHHTTDYEHHTTVGYGSKEKDDDYHDVTVGLEFGSAEHTTKAVEHDDSGEKLGDYSNVGNYDYIESSKNTSSEFRKYTPSGKINSGSSTIPGRKQIAQGSHRVSVSPENSGYSGRHGSQSVHVDNSGSNYSPGRYSTSADYSGTTRQPGSVSSVSGASGSRFSSGSTRPAFISKGSSSGYSTNGDYDYSGKIKGVTKPVTPAYGSSTSAYSTASGGNSLKDSTGYDGEYTGSRIEGFTKSGDQRYTGSRDPSFSEVQQGFATSGAGGSKYSTPAKSDYSKIRPQPGNERFNQPTVKYSPGGYGSRIPDDSVGIGSTAFTGPTPTTVYNQAGYKTISNSQPQVHITSSNGVTSSQFEGSTGGKVGGSFSSSPASSSGSFYAQGNPDEKIPSNINTGSDYTNPAINRYSNNVFLSGNSQNSAIVSSTPNYYPSGQTSPAKQTSALGENVQPGIQGNSVTPGPPITTYRGPNLFTANHRIVNPIITTYRGSTNSKTIPTGPQTTPVYDNRENAGYKTNEYHDNGGRGTIRYNNGFVVTKTPESDVRNFQPVTTLSEFEVSGGRIDNTGATIPGTFPQQFSGPGVFTPEGFTKTGPTRTGITTAQLGGSGSYVIGTSPRPRPNSENIGENAFAGNVGYNNRVIASSRGGAGSPGSSGSYVTQPAVSFSGSTTLDQDATTLAPLLNVEIYTNQPFATSGATDGSVSTFEPIGTFAGTDRPSGSYSDVKSTSGSYSDVKSVSGSYSDVKSTSGQYNDVKSTSSPYSDVKSTSGPYSGVKSTSGSYSDVKSTSGPYSGVKSTSGQYNDVKSTSGPYVDVKSTSGQYSSVKSTSGPYVDVKSTSGQYSDVKSTSGQYNGVKSTGSEQYRPITSSANTDRPTGSYGDVKTTGSGKYQAPDQSGISNYRDTGPQSVDVNEYRGFGSQSVGTGNYQQPGYQSSATGDFRAPGDYRTNGYQSSGTGDYKVPGHQFSGTGDYKESGYQSPGSSDYKGSGYQSPGTSDYKGSGYQSPGSSDYKGSGYQSPVTNDYKRPGHQFPATKNQNQPNYPIKSDFQSTSENYQGSLTNSNQQSPVYQSTDYRQSDFRSSYQSPIVPVGYTTGPKESFQSTIYQAAKIPGSTSVQPVVDDGYKTVVSPTKIPVIVTPVRYDQSNLQTNSVSTEKPSRLETPGYQTSQGTQYPANDYSRVTSVDDRGIFGNKVTSRPNVGVSLSAQAEKGQIYRGSAGSGTSTTSGYTVSTSDDSRNYVTSTDYDRGTDPDAQVVYIPSTTIAPESGVTYRRPFTTVSFNGPNSDSGDEFVTESIGFTTPSYSSEKGYSTVGKTLAGSEAITTTVGGSRFDFDQLNENQGRGSVKYTPNSAYVDEMKTKYLGTAKPISPVAASGQTQSSGTYGVQYTTAMTPSITTYHGNYRKPYSTTAAYDPVNDKSVSAETSVRGRKIIVKLTDLHPILLGKLGAECTCKSDPFDIFRGPRRKHVTIPSSRGVVDLANYDESDVYVDLEADKAIERIRAEASMGQIKAEKLVSQESDEQLEKLEATTTPCPINERDPPKYNGPIIRVYGHDQDNLARLTEAEAENPSSTASSLSRGSSRYIIHADNNAGSATIATGSRVANSRSGKSLFSKPSTTVDRGRKKFEIGKHDAASVIDNEDGECARPGLFRHPKLCNKFYVCHWDEWKQKFSRHVFNCPIHLTFDSTAGACNWPSKGPACQDDNLLV